MKKSKFQQSKSIVLLSVFLITINLIPLVYSDEALPPPPVLTIESYFNLSQTILEANVDNLNTLIGLVQTLSKDEFIQNEFQLSEDFDKHINDLYQHYNTTEAEYVTFKSNNKNKIDWYLKDFPETDENIQDLSNQFQTLLEEFEALLESNGVRGD